MNNEEKKAVEIIKKEITRPDKTPLEVYVTDIKMLLHLIEKQEKVIDEMAEYIRVKTDFTTIGNIKAIKEHFYREVEENE